MSTENPLDVTGGLVADNTLQFLVASIDRLHLPLILVTGEEGLRE